MEQIERRSPITFNAEPIKTENRHNWRVVLEYAGESEGPHLIDLSHRSKWDLQASDLSAAAPWGVPVPEQPGAACFRNGILVSRRTRTEASVWHLSGSEPKAESANAYTDVTDAFALLALVGRHVFSITEKLSALDLRDPAQKSPFFRQGPFCHVPCQVAVLRKQESRGMLLVACARGYAHDMAQAVLQAGAFYGLGPAGEDQFIRRLAALTGLQAE